MLVTRAAVPNHALLFVPIHKAIHNCKKKGETKEADSCKQSEIKMHTDVATNDMVSQKLMSRDKYL